MNSEIVKIPQSTVSNLRALAKKYEVASFVNGDPSCILTKFKSPADIECAAFITAILSFGRREQFMQKVDYLFNISGSGSGIAGAHPAEWLKSGAWKKDFPSGEKKFYRFYSYDDLRDIFLCLQKLLINNKSFGDYLKKLHDSDSDTPLVILLSSCFPKCCAVSHGKQSAHKKLNMFLRWMVRTNSSVDLGLWKWYSPANLIIPLDVHVLQVAEELKLIPENSPASAKTAQLITNELKQIWPEDPCKGDFALFGAGINA